MRFLFVLARQIYEFLKKQDSHDQLKGKGLIYVEVNWIVNGKCNTEMEENKGNGRGHKNKEKKDWKRKLEPESIRMRYELK